MLLIVICLFPYTCQSAVLSLSAGLEFEQGFLFKLIKQVLDSVYGMWFMRGVTCNRSHGLAKRTEGLRCPAWETQAGGFLES